MYLLRSDQIRSDQIRSDQIRSDQIRSEEKISSSDRRHRFVESLGQAYTFLEWWAREYGPRNGVPPTVAGERELSLVLDLLRALTLPELQLMAFILWAVTTDGRRNSDRDWIAAGDRSIRVLHKKARFLRNELQRLRPYVEIGAINGANADETWDLVRATLARSSDPIRDHNAQVLLDLVGGGTSS